MGVLEGTQEAKMAPKAALSSHNSYPGVSVHQSDTIFNNLFHVSLQCFAQSKYSIHIDFIQQIFSSWLEPGVQFRKLLDLQTSSSLGPSVEGIHCLRVSLAARDKHIPAPAAYLSESSLKVSFRLAFSSTCDT